MPIFNKLLRECTFHNEKFILVLITKYYSGDQIREDEKGWDSYLVCDRVPLLGEEPLYSTRQEFD
jgi:hypothetical protein